ncbi:hypothetical protein CFE53_05645 [Methanofervidicoccus sp. A16]|uniref:DUF63 family protein n=1 Tax=Methanofervidicoccus sp. A16 TaxID=2607662 RepID=UPI001187C15F|nr:DUF63 family protein [Methanofervidicoccus sp. A16]AXI25633.1 hypothetical protein CFE53_05645 [Methanofervidicoccus sp. A16]
MDLSNVKKFIYKYYIEPIEKQSGYNYIQEITYGILLFFMVYIFYRTCKIFHIDIDRRFAVVTVFYTVLISLIRALVDGGYIPHTYYTVTPGIVIVIGLYYLIAIILSALILKERYYILATIMAVLPLTYLIFIFLKNMVHIEALFYVLFMVVLIYAIFNYLLERIESIKNILKFQSIDRYVILAQLTDGVATAIGIGLYGYWEQHPLPRFFMDHFGPFIMIPLKLVAVITVLYILNSEVENRDLRNILKITVMALGLAPGLRNLFRIVMGV